MAEASLKLGTDWATKEDYLLGYNDENGNYKPIPFDFSRASIGTRVNRDGLIEVVQDNIPRIDFTGDGSLLLEPQRTNLAAYSEDFVSYWTKENITISSNDTTSPEGVANASKINETASTTYFALSKGFTISSGINHTISLFAKEDERNFLIIRTNLLGSNVNTTFNLSTGVITYNAHTSASIESYSNGWYRCSITATSSSTSLNMAILMSNADVTSNVLPTYLGVAGSGLHIYGLQLESNASYPSSYIPTYGSAVTRSADDCVSSNIDGLIGDNQGTLFVQGFGKYQTGADNHLISLSSLAGGSGTDRILIYISNVTGNLQVYIDNGGIAQYGAPINLGVQGTDADDKIAVAFADNDLSVYVNGSKVGSSTSGTAPTMFYLTFNEWVGSHQNTSQYKQAVIFPTRLSDAELADLTTL